MKDNFIWGAATAAYQVEGAAYEDGKGFNIWDMFCKDGGHVYNQQNGDKACDQYHLYQDDVKLMKDLGIKAYRFSISWARIMPDGTGRVNEQGVTYYNNLIDELKQNGIEPYITLYHWDLPYELQLKGGWLNPESPEWFYEYASLVAERFSDRVSHFMTFNEPQCFIGLGYGSGIHAPGLKMDRYDLMRICHNFILAHGRAVQALREKSKQKLQIGVAFCGGTYYPETDSAADIEAARKMMFDISNDDVQSAIGVVGFLADPILLGHYSERAIQQLGKYMPAWTEEEMEIISQPIDFYGQNLYNSLLVRAGKNGEPEIVEHPEGFPKTAMQWTVTPETLYWVPRFLHERYGKPIYITECGMSCHDWISLDGKVHDPNRVDFIHRYLLQLNKAEKEGADIRGFFMWSLLDNFEWSAGYSERFGIIYVNYQTMKRVPKDSYYFYQSVIRSNGTNL